MLAVPVAACRAAPGTPEPGDSRPSWLDSLLAARRSTRLFADSSLADDAVLKLLWAGCGMLPDGRRTVPSAGALYPLRLLLVCGDVEGISPGVYRYAAEDSTLLLVMEGDRRPDLGAACLGQPWVSDAPASIVIAAEPSIASARYGGRGLRYIYMEAGHASQNIYLMCASLGLGTVAVGAFVDSGVAAVVGLPEDEIPLYVMPIGRTD
jgi:SagB-type dehydrogenase family enzyme